MCENCKYISSALTYLCTAFHGMSKFSVIDPEGDVILVCGETEFQVSSEVLSPRFAEGQVTQSKPGRIELHDDDTESMRFMCAVMHHKSTCANNIGLERLERLAALTDKYDVRTPSKMFALTETNVRFAILEVRLRNRF